MLVSSKEEKNPSKVQQQLVIEAYFLRRLNAKPHPNILRVFAYDTSAQPYHLITELVPGGSLLQFLRSSRSNTDHMPSPSTLVKMILDVMDAVIYLDEQHLVHLAIMADNVLVGSNNVCKLTGFQFAREMSQPEQFGDYEYISKCDEMPIRHASPESLKFGRFSEKSVSWACGILLFEMHTYGVTPFNQFSNENADKLRSHVISGGSVKKEQCIRVEVTEVIQMCLRYEKDKRPNLPGLKTELMILYERLLQEENDLPAASYPSLTNVDLTQLNTAMSCCNVLQGRDEEKTIGFFGSPTRSEDIPMIRSYDGVKTIRELVEKTKKEDLKKLGNLKHKNIVLIYSIKNHDGKFFALVTEYSGGENLLQHVLSQKCRDPNDLISLLVQIVQAVKYMHENNMIHSDLRAENIMVFAPNKVKVSRLGRSKPLGQMMSVKEPMQEKEQDAIRWRSPEVIKDGIYSQSSDIYSFGITCYELFTAFAAKIGSTPDDVKPFATITDDKILGYVEGNNRPTLPEGMPIWFHIAIKQCLLHKPVERPPLALIEDCLTNRKPFDSCLLFHWKTVHEKEIENIDVRVAQPDTARHVLPKEEHKSFKELQQLAAVEVFMKHTYFYKPGGHENYDEQNNEPIYRDPCLDDDHTYAVASYRFPYKPHTKHVRQDPLHLDTVQEKLDEDLYEHIPCHKNKEIRPPQPAPCTIFPHRKEDLPMPTQETGGSKDFQIAFCAQAHPIYDAVESPCPSSSKGKPYVDDVDPYDDVNMPNYQYPSLPPPPSTSCPPLRPSVPISPNREPLPNVPSNVPCSSGNNLHRQDVHTDMYDAVGNMPEECSYHSTGIVGNGPEECSYGAVGNMPEERSWHSTTFSNDPMDSTDRRTSDRLSVAPRRRRANHNS